MELVLEDTEGDYSCYLFHSRLQHDALCSFLFFVFLCMMFGHLVTFLAS